METNNDSITIANETVEKPSNATPTVDKTAPAEIVTMNAVLPAFDICFFLLFS
jgi:hypothetical protein